MRANSFPDNPTAPALNVGWILYSDSPDVNTSVTELR